MAEVGLARIALQQSNHIGTRLIQQIRRALQTRPALVVIAKVEGPNQGAKIASRWVELFPASDFRLSGNSQSSAQQSNRKDRC